MNRRLFLSRLIFALLLLFVLTGDIHGLTLDDCASRLTDDRVLHAEHLTVDIKEQRRGRFDDAWHERVLDQLEVELLLRVVTEGGVVMRQVQLEEVLHAESLSVDALRSQSAELVVISGMLAEESSAWATCAL